MIHIGSPSSFCPGDLCRLCVPFGADPRPHDDSNLYLFLGMTDSLTGSWGEFLTASGHKTLFVPYFEKVP